MDEIIEEVGIPKEIMENCVIIGRSADYILKDSDKINLLRAFIYAPDDVRIHNIMRAIILQRRMPEFCFWKR